MISLLRICRRLLFQGSRFFNIERNWASEVSPTLGCSIEISHDIYIYICTYVCMYVCLQLSMGKQYKKLYAKMHGQTYIIQTRACSKISFGSLK